MTDAERRWLESRGWRKSPQVDNWWDPVIHGHDTEDWWGGSDALRVERAAFEAECRELWRRSCAASSAGCADEEVGEYRARFGPEAFETKSVEATKNQEVEQ